MRLLTADMGGTNSRFGLFSFQHGALVAEDCVAFSSRCATFEELLARLFSHWPGERLARVDTVAFAAAGPVRQGCIDMTNAPFSIRESAMKAAFPRARCLLLNDFEAQAWACLSPAPQREQVLGGEADATEEAFFPSLHEGRSPVAVLGAGTGLGAAWLMPAPRGGRPFVLPSEAGHTPFPFEGGEERAVAECLAAQCGRPVTAEHLLSGAGLARLYAWSTGTRDEPERFTRDPAFARSDCCRLYARFYGRFCRMAALALLPRAVLVTGGVAQKTPALVRHAEFAGEFLRAKGEQKKFLAQTPVWLNLQPQSGLWGAAMAGLMS